MHCSDDSRLAIVGKALETGIFYTRDLNAAVMPEWATKFPAEDVELGAESFTVHTETFPDFLAARRSVEAELKQRPRGTWTVVTYVREDGHTRRDGFMADGAGNVHCGQHHRAHDFASLLKGMVELEIYDTRQVHDRNKAQDKARAHANNMGWRVGMSLSDVRVPGHGKFSTAVIQKIGDTGALTLLCTRRGSAKRFEVTLMANSLELEAPPAPSMPATPCPAETFALV